MIASHVATVDGYAIEYALAGSGSPAIILINGSGGPIFAWNALLERLAAQATVLAYNRPGIGKSAKPGRPQTARECVDALHALLAVLGIKPPLVLVGHSFGGLIANLYARLHPADVAGVMLIEAAAPGDIKAGEATKPGWQKALGRILKPLFGPDRLSEVANGPESARQVENAPAFPGVPVTVATGQKPAMRWLIPKDFLAIRARNQAELATLGSPPLRHILAHQSGHFPQFSEPELIISAIEAMLAELRGTPGQCSPRS